MILVVAYAILRWGISPPAPWSVLSLYMSIVLMAVLIFVSSDRDSWADFIRPIWTTLVSPERRFLRAGLIVVVPLLLGYYAYTQAAARPQATIVMSYGNPYAVADLPGTAAVLTGYGEGGYHGNQLVYADSLVRLIKGEIRPRGRLPVTVSPALPAGAGVTY